MVSTKKRETRVLRKMQKSLLEQAQKGKLKLPTECPFPSLKYQWERFWNKVEINKISECWTWKACRAGSGFYGFFMWDGRSNHNKNIMAHRSCWMLLFGPIPKGMIICHKCDNVLCVNPNHLFVGTCKDNSLDMVKKKRQAFGCKNGGGVKLNDSLVCEILKLKGEISSWKAARIYQVSHTSIKKIWRGESWKHVPRTQ